MGRFCGKLDRLVMVVKEGAKVGIVKLSHKYQRDCLSLVLSIMKYCYKREYVDVNPFRRHKLKKFQEPMTDYVTGEEVEEFLNWCDDDSPYLGDANGSFTNGVRPQHVRYSHNIKKYAELFRFALHSGTSLGEVLGLKRKAIDFENKLIWISEIYDQTTRELTQRTKGKNVRCVEVDEVTKSILKLREDCGPKS